MPETTQRSKNPYRALLARDPQRARRYREALDPSLSTRRRARAFLATPTPQDPRSCKLLYAEGVRLLAGPRARAVLDPETRASVSAALRSFAVVFLAHLRPEAPGACRKEARP